MKIDCDACGSVFTIDDAQLGDEEIGAQCPYCGHVKHVRRGGGGASNGAGPSGSGFANPFGPSGPAFPFGGGATGSASPSGGTPAPLGGRSSGAGFGASNPFEASDPPDRFGASLGGDSSNDRFSAAPAKTGSPSGAFFAAGPATSSAISDDLRLPAGIGPSGFDGPGATPDGLAGSADTRATCQACGTPLTDEFDKVIGLCDQHQRERKGTDGSEPLRTTGRTSDPSWFVRGRGGQTAGPLTIDDLRARVRNGEFGPRDEYSDDGVSFAPMSDWKAIAYLASLGPGREAAPPRVAVAGRAPRTGGAELLRPVIFAAVIGGIGIIAYTQWSAIRNAARNVVSKSDSSRPETPNPLKRYLSGWRLEHPGASGSVHEHLVTANAKHLEDSWAGYQRAEDALEVALLLAEDDPVTIAGYVENLALWRFPLASREERRTAGDALAHALELAPRHPAVHRAAGALGLAAGDLSRCRSGAERAVELDATDGRARLILAECYIEGNVLLSIEEIEHARKLLPDLRRADRVLATAYAKAGRYAAALRLLDERLKSASGNGLVHRVYGDLARDLGKSSLAEQHYRSAISGEGDRQAAHLALGDLQLESGDVDAAIASYDAAMREGGEGERMVHALSSRGRAELVRGRAAVSRDLAERALLLSREGATREMGVWRAAAMIVAGQAALMTRSATTAAMLAKQALEIRVGEPSALVLAGRAAVAQGQKDVGVRRFEEAIANAPWDPRLKGILAATYLGMGGSPQAYALMRKAADVDPLAANAKNRLGPFDLAPVPVVEAIDQFRLSASEERNAAVAYASIGLLRYHLGHRKEAKTAVERALEIDGGSSTALVYRAQLALDAGDAKAASDDARKLLSVERGSALGRLLLGRAYKMQRAYREAKDEFDAALRSDPSLTSARVERAEIELTEGDRDAAIRALEEAFRSDPYNGTTRRILFQIGR